MKIDFPSKNHEKFDQNTEEGGTWKSIFLFKDIVYVVMAKYAASQNRLKTHKWLFLQTENLEIHRHNNGPDWWEKINISNDAIHSNMSEMGSTRFIN